ncbi:trihelix transcription factor GTL1 [Gastrolobium bilobum]|uniref:trihelix transcription factor GTL1 n=1 Tax=Gastrolobium bilobum TaxID=150636 RepID=UPI002AB03040|nr:trihelix transcription factor GTL1 [Gastrolobium bilobum]
MDLFAADHFPVPDHVAPFPDSGDHLYSAADLLLQSRHNPQKLRPIRSNGGPPPSGFHPCPDSTQHPGHPLEPSLQMQDPIASGSGHAPFPSGQESGSSLDDDDDDDEYDNSSASTKVPGSRKRKRKTVRKLEGFVENLVKKVMEKQEQMHKQLMEMIESKERERIKREEAWKQEEMERIKKDEEVRAQERSRNLALIAFIQNLLGHEIQIPQPAEVSNIREDDEVEVNIQKDFNSDLSNNRWPVAEVQALITVRTSLDHKFRLMGSKGSSIWEEISGAMHSMGYNRSAKKCKEKWENINKYYKRTVGSGKKRRENSKTCPYFDELDILYRNGLLNPGNVLSNSNNVSRIEEKDLTQTS